MTEPETFVYVTHIAAARERVWQALVTPDFTRRFWNGRILESDWRAGSPITFRHDYDEGVDSAGTVLVAEPPRRLSYATGATTVTFELLARGDVVELTLTHTGLDASTREMTAAGWAFILSNLKTLLETGNVLPMPESVLAAYR